MTMRNWIAKLDDFLRLGDRDVLAHAGRVTAEMAKFKGGQEFDRWHAHAIEEPSAAERHFIEALGKAKTLEKSVKTPRGKKSK